MMSKRTFFYGGSVAAATVSTDIEFVNSFTSNLLYLLCENSSLNSANFTDRVLFFALILKSFYPSQKIFVTFMINSKAVFQTQIISIICFIE